MRPMSLFTRGTGHRPICIATSLPVRRDSSASTETMTAAELRDVLPEVARTTLAGVRFAVVHETGARANRESRMAAVYDEVDVLVFGHSHIPWDTTATTGLRLLNPGSPTDRRRQPACTYMTATVTGGQLVDVVLHELPRTSRSGLA